MYQQPPPSNQQEQYNMSQGYPPMDKVVWPQIWSSRHYATPDGRSRNMQPQMAVLQNSQRWARHRITAAASPTAGSSNSRSMEPNNRYMGTSRIKIRPIRNSRLWEISNKGHGRSTAHDAEPEAASGVAAGSRAG
jgi:hypothetical protein